MSLRGLVGGTLVALGLAGWWLAACERVPIGPSLAGVTLKSIALQPTVGNPQLCCCHVVGTATNTNTVPVHVTIKFAAYDGRETDPLSRIVYFIKDLEPGATHAIDAAGFLFPCSVIKDLKTEVDVKGITYPPQ